MTTSSNPLASVKLATSVPTCSAASGEDASAAASATSVTLILAITMSDLDMLRSCYGTRSDYATSRAIELDRRSPRLSRQFAACGVVVGWFHRPRLADAIGLIRRRRLIASRRLGERSARRFARKFRRLFLLASKHGAEHAAGAGAKLGWQ